MDEELKRKLVENLYEEVIKRTNRFLHSCKNYTIAVLQLEDDPTYTQIAEHMNEIASIIQILCNDLDDPMTGEKATEYSNYMSEMAECIVADRPDELQRLVDELEQKSVL